MKKVFLLLIIVGAMLTLTLVGCQARATVVQIEVLNMPTKSTYYVGDTPDYTGCTINVLYSDRTVREVPVTADMVSGMDTTGIGNKTTLVTYTENGVRYTTTMVLRVTSRPAESLRVLDMPTVTRYVEGQTIDLTGLRVEAYYSEEQRVALELRDLTYHEETAVLGMTSVSVAFGGLRLDVPITVDAVAVTGLAAEPLAPIYRHQTLHSRMFAVRYVYNNGLTETADEVTFAEEDNRFDTLGTQTVHFSAAHATYGTFTCEVQVDVVEDEVTSASLEVAPLRYEVGEAFLWREVTLHVYYAHSDETCRPGMDSAALSLGVADGTPLTEGAHDVAILAGERTVGTFRIAVGVTVPVRFRAVDGEDVVTCTVGQVPTPQNLMLYAVMSDGTEILVWHRWKAATGVTVTLPDAAVAGQTEASLVYEGLTYTYAVQVGA